MKPSLETIVTAAIFLVVWFGLVGPYCISAESDLLVVAWPCATIIGALIAARVIRKRYLTTTKKGQLMRSKILPLLLALLAFGATGCSTVPAGNVGIKVYLLGGSKGVDHEVVGVGRQWVGINEELYIYPTFLQNYTWTKSKEEGSEKDESFTFQTKDGLSINTDLGVSYAFNPGKISELFQKFRKGPDEITHIYLRNMVRDALNKLGANDSISEIMGPGKQRLLQRVQDSVQAQVAAYGIQDFHLYLIGEMRLPGNVVAAINSKIEATQKAQQAENELQTAKAQAAKKIAEAEGDAKANELKQRTITAELVKWEAIQKWDGHLPQVTSGGTPLIDLK